MAFTRTHIGTVHGIDTVASRLVTVAGAAIPVGALVVCYTGANNTADTYSGSDSDSINTYSAVTQAGASNIRTNIVWSLVANEIEVGDTITVTLSTARSNWAFSADYFTHPDGFAASPLDQSAGAAGTGTAASSGDTATTNQASELAVGSVATANDRTLSPYGTGWTAGTSVVVASGQTREVFPMWKELTATGVVRADGTLNTSVAWSALVATFKVFVASAVIGPPVSAQVI